MIGERALFALLLLVASPCSAECGGRSDARWAVHQGLVLLLNPLGAEHYARFGPCVPLYESDDAAFSENHVEAGVSTFLSPVYFYGGGYAQLVPASFLLVRAEVSGIAVWPLPIDGAGYFARDSYDDGWRDEDVPGDEGSSATGWNVRLIAVLRGKVELAPRVAIYAVNAVFFDYHELGDSPYWLNVRYDLISAQRDWVIGNEGILLLGASVPGGPDLRFGAYSSLRVVEAAGYVGHQVGAIFMTAWTDPDPVATSLDFFLRLGIYTHHGYRTSSLTTMAGLSVDWDLGAI